MAEKKTNTITIDDIEYTEDQLTDQQKVMLNHIKDLDHWSTNRDANDHRVPPKNEAET